MSKSRIKANFYSVSYYKFLPINKSIRDSLPEDSPLRGERYYYKKMELPDGRLYSGWGCRYPTKLTEDDLPEYYILMTNYKKHGYIRTSGVKGLVYHRSPFHNHTFKDDFLYISYSKELKPYVDWREENSTYSQCDEYIFGNDIVNFIAAVEMYSPDYDVSDIENEMVEQYNLYCEEMNKSDLFSRHEPIEKFEDLL